jgi:glutamate---cysteine ligase / carboxylate-amine ligase
MSERRFGESAPWTIGIEEELLVLDGRSLALAPRANEIIAAGPSGEGQFKQELFASMLEIATGVCASPVDALDQLRELRVAAIRAAKPLGLEIAAAGAHPFSRAADQEVADAPRYRKMVEHLGVTAMRQGVTGLHVHVGMPSADACHLALEGLLPWLPLVLALSANSPFVDGEETGHVSNRAEVLDQLPRSGSPPPCASFEDWESLVEHFVRLGIVKDYTQFWWDVRPHPRLGTIEVRMPDMPTAIERSGTFAALLQALCVTVLDDPPEPGTHAGRAIYEQNRWSALRFGPRAELVHPLEDRMVPATDLARELVERVRPAAERLGSASLLDILGAGCEADVQLDIGRTRGLEAVAADLVERSLT